MTAGPDLTSGREFSPQERLANSRRALIRHMQREDDRPGVPFGESGDEAAAAGDSKWRNIKRAIRSWWRNHPAHVALDVASPLVGRYAHEHPFQVLGAAAGIGAATIFLKPWRLVSLGGVLLAAIKSADISGMVLSLLHPSSQHASATQDTE